MKKSIHIPALTSIRGFAALLVVFYHISITFKEFNIPFLHLFHNGSLGVDLFFILSGFIMHHVYCNSSLNNFGTFYKDFMWSRAARIYPIHLFTILFLLILIFVLPDFSERYDVHYFSFESFVYNLLLIQNWGVIPPSWNMVSWSISAEWFMYLLFPLILFLKSKCMMNVSLAINTLLILSTLAAYYCVIYLLDLDGYGGISAGGMIRVFFEFTLGFLMYNFRQPLLNYKFHRYSKLPSLIFLIIVFVTYYIDSLYYLFLPVVAVFVLNLSIASNIITKFMSKPIPLWLGRISYSLYMWHWIVIQVSNWLIFKGIIELETKLDVYLMFTSVTIISMIVAHISYRFIEQKGRIIVLFLKNKYREASS